jgi:hypothetical protein
MILAGRYLSRLKRCFRPQPRTRLLKRMPRKAICAEIGVWKGDFSQQILERTRPKELWLLDPWTFRPEFPDRWYGGAAASNQADMDRIYQSVVDRFAHRRDVRIHRAPSSELPEILGNRQLDWVYIDGDHGEEAVRSDLGACWKVVRSGGWITGDDYFWADECGNPSVQTAVDSFVAAHGLTLHLIGGQFIIPKPRQVGRPSSLIP